MGSWVVVLLRVTTAMLFRWHGDTWPVTVAKLAVMTALSLVVAAVGGLMAWQW